MHQLQGARTPQPPQLCAWDTGEESLSVSQASDSGPFSVMECWISSSSSWEYSRVGGGCLTTQHVFCGLGETFNCVPRGSPWGCFRSVRCLVCKSWTFFVDVWLHQRCSVSHIHMLWTEYLDITRWWVCVWFDSGFHICSLQMIWFCWLYWM